MKRLIIIALLAVSTTVYAAGYLQKDAAQQYPIQGFAPDPAKDTTLAITRQAVSNASDVAWSAYAPADCIYRNTSSAVRAGTTMTIPGGAWHTRVVNKGAGLNPRYIAYTHYSGCTSGRVQRQ